MLRWLCGLVVGGKFAEQRHDELQKKKTTYTIPRNDSPNTPALLAALRPGPQTSSKPIATNATSIAPEKPA